MAYDKVVDSGVLDGKLTAIADAIRGKTGGADALTLEQMATEIEGIQAGGGGDETALFCQINNQTIENFVATENMVKLRQYMFYGNTTLRSVDLSKLMAPLLSSGKWDIQNMIGQYCFSNCTALESIVLPEILAENTTGTCIIGRAFMGCVGLNELVTDYPCYLSSQSTSVFESCTALKRVIVPNWSLGNALKVFAGCTSLEIVDCKSGPINANCFQNDAQLKTLVIRNSSVVSLSNVSAFTGTPFASGGAGGTVYVPQALIESYKTATNWSTLYAAGTCNFVAIEGSEYE